MPSDQLIFLALYLQSASSPFLDVDFLKTVLVIVVQYFGTAFPTIYSKQNHLTISFINLIPVIPVPLFINFSNTALM